MARTLGVSRGELGKILDGTDELDFSLAVEARLATSVDASMDEETFEFDSIEVE